MITGFVFPGKGEKDMRIELSNKNRSSRGISRSDGFVLLFSNALLLTYSKEETNVWVWVVGCLNLKGPIVWTRALKDKILDEKYAHVLFTFLRNQL